MDRRAIAPAVAEEVVVIIERRGRKRKNGARYPSGELREARAPSPAMIAARMPHRGSVSQEDAVNAIAESELGRMHLKGKISKGQYDAGCRFASVVARYRATIMGPRPVLAGGRGYDCPGDHNCDDCECRRRAVAYNDAYAALIRAGQQAAKAVRIVALQDQPCPWALRSPLDWGLSALRQHFDMEDDGKARPTRAWVAP